MQEHTFTRKIKVDHTYNISGSPQYAGIENGRIKLVAILDVPALDADCLSAAITWAEIEHQSRSDEPVQSVTEEYMDQPWAKYFYTGAVPDREGSDTPVEYLYLPLTDFCDHISMDYYGFQP